MREKDHKIELELGAKSPAMRPYRMAPPLVGGAKETT